VRVAAVLWILGGLGNAGSAVQQYLVRDRIADRMTRFDDAFNRHDPLPQLTERLNHVVVGGMLLAEIVVAGVFLVLYAAFAWQLRKGHNWARIVLAVFAGFGVLGVGGLAALNATGLWWLGGVPWPAIGGAVCLVAAAALSYLPRSAGYFSSGRSSSHNPPPSFTSPRS
jgi:hypothetical protein